MHKNIEILNRACGKDNWVTVVGTDWDTLVMQDGISKPTLEHWMSVCEAVEREFEALAYVNMRASEYPSIGDQLDALFHAGVFPADMAAKIQAIKDKYPKG